MKQEYIFTDSAFVKLLAASKESSQAFNAEYKSKIVKKALEKKISDKRAYFLINLLGLREA